MIARRIAAALLVLLTTAAGVLAEEPSGCDKFAWNIERERALLEGRLLPAGDGLMDRTEAAGLALTLMPLAEAKLPRPPERQPKDQSTFAGIVSFSAGPGPTTYRISLSDAAWIDVVQGGAFVKSGKFTGARDCPGIRKSVEFYIGPTPFVVQISGAASPAIRLVLTRSR